MATTPTFLLAPFRTGPAAIRENGIVIGRGGGITQLFHEIMLLPTDMARFASYVALPDGSAPDDYQSAHLLILETGEYLRLTDALATAGFWDVTAPPVTSTMIEYVVATKKGSERQVVWNEGTSPRGLERLVEMVCNTRQMVALGFTRAHGCTPDSPAAP